MHIQVIRPRLRSNIFPSRNAHFDRVCEFNFVIQPSRYLSSKIPVSILDNQDIIERIPLEDVRNFCFIAHVDHGKSSLSSRILELTGNLGKESQQIALKAAAGKYTDEDVTSAHSKRLSSTEKSSSRTNDDHKERIEIMDTLSVEQERGITVKASTATMLYRHPSAVGPEGVLLLNMIDTPGHVGRFKQMDDGNTTNEIPTNRLLHTEQQTKLPFLIFLFNRYQKILEERSRDPCRLYREPSCC